MAKGKSGKGHTRIGRHRKSSACQRSILSERKWYDISIRAVPRCSPGHAGLGGRTCRPDVRSATELPAACACWKIKAYAVTAKVRLASAPDVPTVDEAGLPGFYISVWSGMWAPKGTPPAVISKLNAAIVDALSNPAVQRRLGELGQEVPARDQQTPAALAAFQAAEIERWWPIVKAMNLKPE